MRSQTKLPAIQRLAGATVLAFAGFLSTGQAADITAALVLPLTGSQAGDGLSYTQGADLATEAINAQGGILGRKLRIATIDDGCDPNQAEAAAQAAIDEHPGLILGHDCSSTSIRAAPLYAKAGILQITPKSTHPALTGMHIPTLFRLIGRDDWQGAAGAALIAERWPQSRIAVLDDGQTYGKGLADEVRKGLAAHAVPIALNLTYRPDALSYADAIATLQAKQIDVLYIGGYALDISVLLKELKSAGPSMKLLCGDSASDEAFQRSVPPGLTLLFTNLPDRMRAPAAAPAVAAAKAHHADLTGDGLVAYAALTLWADAVKQAGSLEAGAVAAALHGGHFDSVIGPVSFDAAGDLVGPAGAWTWYRLHDGKVAPL